MFADFFQSILGFFYFILHVSNSGEFPKKLTKEEEKELLNKYEENKDEQARKKLIEHNLRLVAHIIKKYYSTGYDQEDLISIGTIGLIKGINSYNSSKKTQLATYASKCIENEILMYFRSQKKTAQDVYMSEPIDFDKDGNALTISDIVSDGKDMIEDIDKRIKIEKLKKYIESSLDEREKQIMRYRYGLNGNKELTQREVAKELDISRSYVSRIEKKCLQTLKDEFDKNSN